jgi:hypothetical protein
MMALRGWLGADGRALLAGLERLTPTATTITVATVEAMPAPAVNLVLTCLLRTDELPSGLDEQYAHQ